jgi:hypothetical protein
MATETPAQMAARFRKMAQDPKLPQSVKNTYLDKANEVEKAAAKPTMNKGGMMKPPIKKPLPPMSGKPPIKKLPKPTMMAKGGAVVAKAPAKGKAKPKKYAEGGDMMAQQSMPAVGGMAGQSPMQKQAPMGMPAQQEKRQNKMPEYVKNIGGNAKNVYRQGQKFEQTLQGIPAYQQLQTMARQFNETNQPTPAQIAQMQQYQRQIQTNPDVAKQQQRLQAEQEKQRLYGFEAPRRQFGQQPPMAKGGMVVAKAPVKKKPATKPMTKMAKGGAVKSMTKKK